MIQVTFRCLVLCLHIRNHSLLSPGSHFNCTSTQCNDSILTLYIEAFQNYTNELSKTLFQKKNLRGNRTWWIPVFCSLCIQGVIRSMLLENLKDYSRSIPQGLREFLYPAVRLFGILSSGFDPVVNHERSTAQIPGIGVLCTAVGRGYWGDNGIKSSAEFLRLVFEFE